MPGRRRSGAFNLDRMGSRMLGPPGGMKEVGSSTVVQRSASASEPRKEKKRGGGLMCLHTQSSMSASSEVAPWQAHAASARMLACEHTQTQGGGVCGMGWGGGSLKYTWIPSSAHFFA